MKKHTVSNTHMVMGNVSSVSKKRMLSVSVCYWSLVALQCRVSAVQQSESAALAHISPLSLRFPSI